VTLKIRILTVAKFQQIFPLRFEADMRCRRSVCVRMHTRIDAFGLFIRNKKISRNINARTIVKTRTYVAASLSRIVKIAQSRECKKTCVEKYKQNLMAKDLKIYWWRIKLLKSEKTFLNILNNVNKTLIVKNF